jgi:cysteine sulfinate desulfinase/cysteine desulfurase-like protein
VLQTKDFGGHRPPWRLDVFKGSCELDSRAGRGLATTSKSSQRFIDDPAEMTRNARLARVRHLSLECGRMRPLCVGATRRAPGKRRHVAAVQNVQSPGRSQIAATAISSQLPTSAGAACHSGGLHLSDVLKAMKLPVEWAQGTVRLSTGRMTTQADIERVVQVLAESVVRTRRPSTGAQGTKP